MKYTKNPTIKALQDMTTKLKEATGATVAIKIDVWRFHTGTQEVSFRAWLDGKFQSFEAPTWPEFVDAYKKELKNATKHL